MPDPRERPESREEAEQRGAHARTELQALPLLDELPVGELVAQHERPGGRRVHDREARLDLPGTREDLGEVDARLPIDLGGKGGRIQPAAPAPGYRGIRDGELPVLVARGVIDGDAVGPVPPADAERRLHADGGLAAGAEQGDGVWR